MEKRRPIYVILWVLFVLKQDQYRVLNPMLNEYETDKFIIRIGNAKENLKELKTTLFQENASSLKHQTFEENFKNILDELRSNNSWMFDHLRILLDYSTLLFNLRVVDFSFFVLVTIISSKLRRTSFISNKNKQTFKNYK